MTATTTSSASYDAFLHGFFFIRHTRSTNVECMEKCGSATLKRFGYGLSDDDGAAPRNPEESTIVLFAVNESDV